MFRGRVPALVLAVLLFPVYAFPAGKDISFVGLDELRELVNQNNGELPAYFETVTHGVEKQTYNILIADAYDAAGTTIIMFKSMHYIAAGMSGSPVYINGKNGEKRLVGAVAYFFNQYPVKVKWGGISPAVKMREESQQFEHAFKNYLAGHSAKNKMPLSFSYKDMTFEPVPLGVRNFSGIGDEVKLSVSGGKPAPTAGPKTKFRLEAGMPIVADLIEWTDQSGNTTSLGAMGTITYVGPEGQVYAFGHPFMGVGMAMYQFRLAKIIDTLWSEQFSFKLQGEQSDVVGFIGFDGRYGIYGFKYDKTMLSPETFSISYKWGNDAPAKYLVKTARTPVMATLLSASFNIVGGLAGVPSSELASTTEMKSVIHLSEGHPLVFDNVFSSSSHQFGPDVIYKSSYENAYEGFMSMVYNPVKDTPFNTRIRGFDIEMRFIPGSGKVLHLASANFPTKVVFGTTPELEVLLVSQDNSIAMVRKIPVEIDWTTVEQPRYTAKVKDTDKESEKVVRGNISVYSSQMLGRYISDDERDKSFPSYFLNSEEYIRSLRERFKLNNKRIFVKTSVRKKSGLLPEPAKSPSVSEENSSVEDGWTMYPKGLTERASTVKETPYIYFTADIGSVPGGYMMAPTDKMLTFEVVLQADND